MSRILARLLLAVAIAAASTGLVGEAMAETRPPLKKIKVMPTTTLVKGVAINPSRPTGLVVTTEQGYVCSTENGLCVCAGEATSDDCRAMAENICKRGDNGTVDLSCNGITCSCEWRTGPQVGGLGGQPAETQGAR